jgi:hypothetical protein
VAQDSKASGSVHVRDEHANVQYRVNGIPLPEGISGFGQSVDSRFVDRIDFVTGALPAQYGLRTAGVVDIETKEGSVLEPGGNIGALVGGHDTFQPSFELQGSKDALSYYVTGNFLTNSQGIENPQPTRNALHDRTQQTRGFAYLSDLLDDNTRLGMMVGTYQGNFEIPNNPNQTAAFSLTGVSDVNTGFNARPSSDLNQRQREVNHYAILSLQKSSGALDHRFGVTSTRAALPLIPRAATPSIPAWARMCSSPTCDRVANDASYNLMRAHRPLWLRLHPPTDAGRTTQRVPRRRRRQPDSTDPLTIVDDSSSAATSPASTFRTSGGSTTADHQLRRSLRPRCRVHQRTPVQPRLNALWNDRMSRRFTRDTHATHSVS